MPCLTRLLILFCLLTAPALAAPSIEVAFSPGRATDAVVETIREARHTIRLAAYTFTSKPIARALLDAHNRGVRVAAVLDKSNATGRYSAATFLANAGIPVRVNRRYAIMHNKFMVIDGVTAQTGSMNYTKAGTEGRNAENVVVLRDMSDAAGRYEAEWQRLWNESEP